MLEETTARLQKKSLQNQSISECRSTFDYGRTVLLRAKPWQLWTSLWERLRGIRVIAFTLKALGFLLSVLGNTVPLLLFTILFLVVLPILLIWGCAMGIRATVELRRHKSFFRSLEKGRVYILFPTKTVNAFQRQNIRSLACRGKVILVSPWEISSAGVYTSTRKFYATVRTEGNDIWLMRGYLLPRLRRLLRVNADAVWMF